MHGMYLIACVMRFKMETCGRHLGSDCDDDHISNRDKAEDPPNSAICLGKLLRSACLFLGQDCAMTYYCIPIPSFATW
jgi:hypothetical protein